MTVSVGSSSPRCVGRTPWRAAHRPSLSGSGVAVLIRSTGRVKPSRGLILDWNLEGRRWEAWPATPLSAPPGVFHRGPVAALQGFRPGSACPLPQLVAAACQVGGFGGVARQLDGFVVRRA